MSFECSVCPQGGSILQVLSVVTRSKSSSGQSHSNVLRWQVHYRITVHCCYCKVMRESLV